MVLSIGVQVVICWFMYCCSISYASGTEWCPKSPTDFSSDMDEPRSWSLGKVGDAFPHPLRDYTTDIYAERSLFHA